MNLRRLGRHLKGLLVEPERNRSIKGSLVTDDAHDTASFTV